MSRIRNTDLRYKNPIVTYNMVFVGKIFETLSQVSEPWTPEGGLVTAAMKLKRKSIEHAFQVLLVRYALQVK